MEKNNRNSLRILVEILAFSLVLFLINFFIFSDNPGFLSGPFNPYTALALIAAAYYGKFFGFITFLVTLSLMMIPVSRESALIDYWKTLWQTQSISITIVLIGVYLLGMIRDSYTVRIKHYQNITRKEVMEKSKYKKEAEALAAVNNELEERVLRQTESVTSLYTQIKALHTQNLTETLNVLLKTVNKFSWAEKASIWRYDQSSLQLVMIANIGWQPDDYDNTILDIDESIEGWSFRNNMIFSVRMLLEYDHLSKMDKKRNIFTFPINFSSSSWGILNIEEMPFTKYNLYVEKILSILVDLAAPEIERAVEYESIVTFEETNPFTNLPAYSQFYSMLEKTIAKASTGTHHFSVVLIELLNFSEIQGEFGEESTFKLILELLDKLNKLSKNKIDFFHYKENNQIAMYYPDIDYDGVSMFCLETLGIINNTAWKIYDRALVIDAILGYSSFGNQVIPVEELLSVAENLLEMQKV
jgi:polysaccharide biosynthesis protein PelD